MEIDWEQVAAKGAVAKAFRDSQSYQEAFNLVLATIVEAFFSTDGMNSPEDREKIFQRYESLQAVDDALSGFVEQGAFAEDQLRGNE